VNIRAGDNGNVDTHAATQSSPGWLGAESPHRSTLRRRKKSELPLKNPCRVADMLTVEAIRSELTVSASNFHRAWYVVQSRTLSGTRVGSAAVVAAVVCAAMAMNGAPPVQSELNAQPTMASPSVLTIHSGPVVTLTAAKLSTTGRSFSYGYDLNQLGPFAAQPGVQSASKVAASISGAYQDIPIMGWGVDNPEPSPGVYDFSQIARRLALVQSTGGIPVITLSASPDWMKGGKPGITDWGQINVAPTPQHYQDFANLCAAIAKAFPQVKYFVVWKELEGFWDFATQSWNAAEYTTLYNDVYRSIKAVRPDAMVGGPYAVMTSWSSPNKASPRVAIGDSPIGPWGTLDQTTLNAISYWLEHSVGADFVAVDGPAFTKDAGLITDPLTSTGKYAAVDQWLAEHTSLPIVWMESHLLPNPSAWSDQQQAAIRIAALLQMASSGASLGMQWDPTQVPGWDEGLWTATNSVDGGQPTVLGLVLPSVLAVLTAPVALVAGEPAGALVASGADGTVTVKLSNTSASVTVVASPA
jgi:hypothetical protein